MPLLVRRQHFENSALDGVLFLIKFSFFSLSIIPVNNTATDKNCRSADQKAPQLDVQYYKRLYQKSRGYRIFNTTDFEPRVNLSGERDKHESFRGRKITLVYSFLLRLFLHVFGPIDKLY